MDQTLDQTYSFKNKELQKTKNKKQLQKTQTPFCTAVFLKLCTKFQGKQASRSNTGSWGTWQPMIFP